MYHCVQQYHHPRVPWNSGGRPWWQQRIARFFDGLLWPSPPGWGAKDSEGHFWHSDGYPEQFDGSSGFTWSGERGALFWHWSYNSGWSPSRITEWMKSRWADYPGDTVHYWDAFDVDALDMSRDADFCALFHSFGRAVAIDNVTYSTTGVPISNRAYWGPTPWERKYLSTPKDLKRGEERDISVDLRWLPNPNELNKEAVLVKPWVINAIEAEFEKGQVSDVSIGHRDYIQRYISGHVTNFTIDRASNGSIYQDVQFAYRLAGEVNLEMLEGGEARTAVPEGQLLTKYEIFATCTGGTYDNAPLEVKVKRIF